MHSNIVNKKTPKFLILIFFVGMWERFSYHGVTGLLVLFLTSKLGFADQKSYLIYSLFAALCYIGPIVAGTIADRWIGSRNMVFLGGIIIAFGHMIMTLVKLDPNLMFLGIALITVGTSFFKGNISSLLGVCYTNSKERERGFTLFHVVRNLGAFFAFLSCGYVASFFGWHYVFGFTGAGMVCGLFVFAKFSYVLGDKGLSPRPELMQKKIFLNLKLTHILFLSGITLSFIVAYLLKNFSDVLVNLLNYAGIVTCFILTYITIKLTAEQRKKMIALVIFIIFTMLFYSLQMQLGSLILLFTERNVVNNILGFPLPATVFQAIDPFIVIISGLVISAYFKFDEKYALIKFSLGLLCTVLAFLILYIGCLNANDDNRVDCWYLFFAFSLIAIGEIFILPFVQSRIFVLSPNHLKGFMMGIFMLALAFSNMAGILISKFVSVPSVDGKVDNLQSLMIYKSSFLDIAKFNLVIFLIFLLLIPLIKWLSNSSPKIVNAKS